MRGRLAMVVWLAVGVILGLPSSAPAGPNAAGTLILHASAATYSSGVSDYCGSSELPACSTAVTSLPWDPGTPRVFYAIAAFPDTSEPRLKAITFGVDYDSTKFVMLAHGKCGDFEVPDGRWPAPGTGTGMSWTSTQTGFLTEVYWFAGYPYSGQGSDSTFFALTAHPGHGGVFVDDHVPGRSDSIAAYGRLGFGMNGNLACPVDWYDESAEPEGGGVYPDTPGQAGGAPEQDTAVGDLTFVETNSTSAEAFDELTRQLRDERNLRVLVTMPPDGIICRATEAERAVLAGDNRVERVTIESITGIPDVTAEDMGPGDPGFTERVWNGILEPPAPGRSFPRSDKSENEAFRDSLFYPDGERGEDRGLPPTLPDAQTSIYLMGDIGVHIFLPESDDQGECNTTTRTENWTDAERNTVFLEVQQMFTGMALLAPNANVSFRLRHFTHTPTTIEPIRYPLNESLWKHQAMDSMGVAPNDSIAVREREFINQCRAVDHDDWGFVGYVVDDSCDPDHHFAGDSLTAGMSNIFGPGWWMALIPGNGPGGSAQLDRVMTHETCHIFGAADEYTPFPCSWGVLHGYLRVANGNADSCAVTHSPCLMHDLDNYTLCPYTRGQIGWRDSIPPESVLDPVNHPQSSGYMLVGSADNPVAPGDWVDIIHGDTWVKRLIASRRNVDGGRMLWDGVDASGRRATLGRYGWLASNGADTLTVDMLRSDEEAPTIYDLTVSPGTSATDYVDTLSFQLEDPDTRGARVRATASLAGGSSSVPIADEFFRRTDGVRPIKRPLDECRIAGTWNLVLTAWDTGVAHYMSDTLSYVSAYSSVDEQTLYVPELRLSRSRPNPSADMVSWELERRGTGPVDLRVVGVDGRTARSWTERMLPGGHTRVLWDGKTEGGARVAAGRYYLVVTDKEGRHISTAITIVR